MICLRSSRGKENRFRDTKQIHLSYVVIKCAPQLLRPTVHPCPPVASRGRYRLNRGSACRRSTTKEAGMSAHRSHPCRPPRSLRHFPAPHRPPCRPTPWRRAAPALLWGHAAASADCNSRAQRLAPFAHDSHPVTLSYATATNRDGPLSSLAARREPSCFLFVAPVLAALRFASTCYIKALPYVCHWPAAARKSYLMR